MSSILLKEPRLVESKEHLVSPTNTVAAGGGTSNFFWPPKLSASTTNNDLKLKQANPYKSTHAKRILEEHYNIKTEDGGMQGHEKPVFYKKYNP